MTEAVYAAPQNPSMAYESPLLFSPVGRIRRSRYFLEGFAAMGISLASYVIAFLATLLEFINPIFAGVSMIIVLMVGYMLSVWVAWVSMIKRLHDLGYSGWMSLLYLVPIANFVIAIMMLFVPSKTEANRFGEVPPVNKTQRTLALLAIPALILIMIAMVGVIAAIALPAYQASLM